MPLREFGCSECGFELELYHPSTNPETVPRQECPRCEVEMGMLWSIPKIDTSSTFGAFPYTGPDGRKWNINNLHALRAVEHAYTLTGHNVRFDAYSADPNNPNDIDGMGMPYHPRTPDYVSPKAYMDTKSKGGSK